MGGAALISPERRAQLLADERDLDAGAEEDRGFWRNAAADTNAAILELGCGGGRLLRAVAPVATGQLIGVDLDPDALALATERLPGAHLVAADARTWRGAPTLRAGLVILGGDLLSLIAEEEDLRALLATAVAHLAVGGQVGIDATRIDPELLSRAASAARWAVDIEREDGAAGVPRVRRESRITPDPARRERVALLSIRHRRVGDNSDVPPRPPFAIRAWGEDELLEAVALAGLERVASSGGEARIRWLLRSRHE